MGLGIGDSSLSQAGLFAAELVDRVELVVDDFGDTNSGTTKRFKPFASDAVMLVPPSLDQWLPQDYRARFIEELVDNELGLSDFYATYVKAKRQPSYDPRLMLRIILYGYCVGSGHGVNWKSLY